MKPSTRIWSQLRVHRRAFSTTARRLDNYAFVGLGQMGYQMARNLQAKLGPNDALRIFDLNKPAAEKLAQEMKTQQARGAAPEVSASAAEASREADIIITCLPEPHHVKAVFQDMLKGDLPARPSGRIYIDCSTIDPSSSREVASAVSSALPNGQGTLVDAPMSGGVVGATAGTLTFMLGAPDALVERIEPILLRMGKKVLHCGPHGTGLSAKLANNYILAVNNIATAEALNLGVRWGLDPKVLTGVINVSTGRCWPSEVNNPVPGVVATSPASRDYSGGFGISLMRKDLKLAILAAGEAQARLELADKAREVYETAETDDRCKGKDFSVIYRWLGGKE